MAIDGKGRPTREQAEEKKKLNSWLLSISTYENKFKSWEARVEKILKRYRDERSETSTTSRFNILWSNVQTLIPATFSRLPQPDVSRRFRDNDPVGRVASLILERSLDFEVQHYPDYRATLKQAVADRFLGGRGTAWARYDPHIRTEQVSEDVDGDAVPNETLEYECAPVDYVHWRDFGHSIARTWEEVTRVWRRVYMTRAGLCERFGDEDGKKIPLDATPEDQNKDSIDRSEYDRALIFEGWDKEKKEAVWISKSMNKILDVVPDPLGLEGFFPCPRPLYATVTNESLVPVPDFTLYQDQALELDTLSERIDGLVKALQVRGTYDASVPELARLFTEATNTQLIPVKNWAAFVEKNGLQGAISLVDLAPIAAALQSAYEAFFQVKAKVDELTGLSDIIRGVTDPNETLGAQELKGQYASLRLKDYQQQVAQFATDALRLKAQIICAKFDPQTIIKMSSTDQLSQADQQYVPAAMQLLLGERAVNPEAPDTHQDSPLRSFRIEIAADTLVQLDEQQEKQNAVEFVTAVGTYFKEMAPIVQAAPEMVPLVGELLKYAVARFKAGKTVEGVIDEAMEKAKQQALQPKQPPPNPEMEKIKLEYEDRKAYYALESQKLQLEARKHADDVQLRMHELAKPEAVEQVNPQREQAEVAKVYADIDLTEAQAEKARAEASVVPQKAALEEKTAEATVAKTTAETSVIEAPAQVEKAKVDLEGQLKSVMEAVEALNKRDEDSAGRAVQRVERMRGPDGSLIGVKHHLANGEVQEVAVH